MYSSLLLDPYQYKVAHMSPYTPFRSRRWIHHFFLIRYIENIWWFFMKSSWGIKIIIAAIICIILGLFSPWIEIDANSSIGAFSLLCGGIGWWVSILLIILLIHLVSYDFTQKIQKTWHMNFGSEYIYIRFGGIIMLMTIIVSICLMGAASTISVSSNIRMTTGMSGLVLTLLGGLLLVVGGTIVRKSEEKQSYKHVFVQGVENEDHDSYKKILWETSEENMKLPI